MVAPMSNTGHGFQFVAVRQLRQHQLKGPLHRVGLHVHAAGLQAADFDTVDPALHVLGARSHQQHLDLVGRYLPPGP